MKEHGLRKSECLLKPYQYQNVYKSRRLKKSSIVWLYSIPNGLEYNRLGISASKKVCSNNVNRNRVKRILKQIYQLNKSMFGRGVDIILVVKKLPKELNFGVFDSAIQSIAGDQQ